MSGDEYGGSYGVPEEPWLTAGEWGGVGLGVVVLAVGAAALILMRRS